ncbi:unnamed protein product [Rodentolepis nana]|uniref:Bromo domain-containing protein n=1 Tax=Rodentolepis nana TaxID=102285 RepID=A0A0R3TAP1_RODNA|nr:unnamed protein product [Rodentolepis nana]
MEGTVDPNTIHSSNVANLDQLITKPILECLGPRFTRGAGKIDVDNFISFAPNIKLTVPPKPHDSNHSLPKSRNLDNVHTHKILVDTLTDMMELLKKEISTNSPPSSPIQIVLEDRLIRNLDTTGMLLADQRRLIKKYYNFYNGAKENTSSMSATGKVRTENAHRIGKEMKSCSRSSKLNGIISWLVERNGLGRKNLKESLRHFNCEEDEECTSSTSPQTFSGGQSEHSRESSDEELTSSSSQSETESTNDSQSSDTDSSSEEHETSYSSSIIDQEEDCSSSSSSKSLNIYSSEQSETSSIDIKPQTTDLERRNPPSLSLNARGIAKTVHFNKDSKAKITSSSSHDEMSQKPTCREAAPRNKIRRGLFAPQNATTSSNDQYIAKAKKILLDRRRNEAKENRSTPSTNVPSPDPLDVAKIFALLLKFCAKDVAMALSKILSPEGCEEKDTPPKIAKGMANITIHVDDLRNLALLLGTESNATSTSNVKSESAEEISAPNNRQIGNNLSSPSNDANDSVFSECEKKVATLNLQDSCMKAVPVENPAPLSESKKFTSPDFPSGRPRNVCTCSLKANDISATCEPLKPSLTAGQRMNDSPNANIQKSGEEVGNNASFIDVQRDLQQFLENVTYSDKALHASHISEDSTKNSKLNDWSFDSEKYVNKTDVKGSGAMNPVFGWNTSPITSESESISSNGSFDFADDGSDSGESTNSASVSVAPVINDNSNSLVEVHDAPAVNLEENGPAHVTSKSNSALNENNVAGQNEQGTINSNRQGSESNSSGDSGDEITLPFKVHELEYCDENPMVNSLKDFVSLLNRGKAEDYDISNNRESAAEAVYSNCISCVPGDNSCNHYGGPINETFPVASKSNEFTNYVHPSTNVKMGYYDTTTNETGLNGVWPVNQANCGGHPGANNLTNFGTVSTYPNSQKLDYGTNNLSYPGPCHIPIKWIDPVNIPFTSDYGRCLPYGVPCHENYNSYAKTNSFTGNGAQWEPHFPVNYQAPMIAAPMTRRKYASHDPVNDSHLNFGFHNHGHFRANSEPNNFSNIDYFGKNIENNAWLVTANHLEHVPVNVRNSSHVSLPQTYRPNSTHNSISTMGYASEVSYSNRSSRVNNTSSSPINSRSRMKCVSGEVQSANATSIPVRFSRSSVESLKEDGSSRAAPVFPPSLYYEANFSDPSQMDKPRE